MMKWQRMGERINIAIDTERGELRWSGLVADFEQKFGVACPDLPEGFRERYYEPGRIHRLSTARKAEPLGDTWPEGDEILAHVAGVLEAEPEPEPAPVARAPSREDDDAAEDALMAVKDLHAKGDLTAGASMAEVIEQINLLRRAKGLSRPAIPASIDEEIGRIRARRR